MRTFISWVLVPILGALSQCSPQTEQMLSSCPMMVPQDAAAWTDSLGRTYSAQVGPDLHDPAWWLEGLRLRPHLVRAANDLAVGVAAVGSVRRALILTGKVLVSPTVPHPECPEGEDGE